MMHLVQPEVRDGTARLRNAFANAQPFRHMVVDDFLDRTFCERLMADFPAFDRTKALDETGKVGLKAVVTDIARISPAYREFDRLMRSPDLLRWLGEITSIDHLLYDPDYIGGGTHENLHGQDLDAHVDFNYHPRRPLHRRLNLILFLNPAWKKEWGGCLELDRDPWNPGADSAEPILPLANRCVVFETTESSWHGFHRIVLPEERRHESRRSLAVYFYTKERPPAETAPEHSTIYVPRPLPGHFQPGYTLQPADMHQLHGLLQRRDDQIRFLYEREKEYSRTLSEFSKTLAGILRSRSVRLVQALSRPLRRLRGSPQ
jgi:hypothetical protein